MQMIHDVLVIGAGPGGMQAAIAAASEGLKTLVLERDKVGGQIGQTPKLENSVFANGGLTGPQFATMMREQADSMGVSFEKGDAFNLRAAKKTLTVGVSQYPRSNRVDHHIARTVVLAMGNKWNDIDIPGMKEGIAAGLVKIGPVDCLHADVKGKDVAVFGGGPAAGQAILELALKARRVHVIMRSHYRMPQYLIDRISSLSNVVTHPHSTITTFSKTDALAVYFDDGNELRHIEVAYLFSCNGLKPATDWLKDVKGIQLDPDGRIITSAPSLETAIPNVYAIGDCRSGSTPRVGVAIGDGSMVVTEIWKHFSQSRDCHSCKKILG